MRPFSLLRLNLVGSGAARQSVRSYLAGRVPSKGVREQPAVPDRLKNAVSYFGNQATNVVGDDTPFVPQDKRQNLVREVLGMHQNLKSAAKLDRLKVALAAAQHTLPNSEKWKEVYVFLRTTEQCCELVKDETDYFPKGSSLWIDLTECEEQRMPHVCQMPNGMLVFPSFSFEEYLNHYFQRLKIFDAVWFPVPRMGSKYEEYCSMEFPVCATGKIANMCTLATVSVSATQFGLGVNLLQGTTKFLTYPEMIRIAQKAPFSGDTVEGFHPALQRTFDTTKMELKRISTVAELRAALASRPSIPQIAQLELQLLIFEFVEVEQIFVRTVATPKWKQMLGKSEVMTQIDVVLKQKDAKVSRAVAERLSGWSFLEEFQSDIHFEFGTVVPPADSGAMLLYDGTVDGEMYRSMAANNGPSLKSLLDYDAPL